MHKCRSLRLVTTATTSFCVASIWASPAFIVRRRGRQRRHAVCAGRVGRELISAQDGERRWRRNAASFGSLLDIVYGLRETLEIVVTGLGQSWPSAG
jgi:hypothetical protein